MIKFIGLLIIGPLDINVGGLIFYQGFFFLYFFLSFSPFFFLSFFFSSATLRDRWTKLNQIDHMLLIEYDLKMHVWNLEYPLPYKPGAKKHLFGPTPQLNAKFNGLYLRNEKTV